ncbi:hypothetical protein CsSME_00001738 [Camellia sinensis var. sinensis]
MLIGFLCGLLFCMGFASLFGLVGCLVSYIVLCVLSVLFSSLWCVLFICPYIHPKFQSISFDGRGYLGTKMIYGQSGVLFFFSFLLFFRFCECGNVLSYVLW